MDSEIAPNPQDSDLKSEEEEEEEDREELEEGGGGGGGSEEEEKGWSVLKKAAAAAAAMAAAPAVVPPALVASAVGIALSLPFAAYLAALACTHRLMRSLLPLPSSYTSSGRSMELRWFGSDPDSSDEDNELLYSDETIWDQIEALRTIVGYQEDAVRSSCAHELRALLTFAGVEPPISLNDPFDPIGVRDNLRFLKFLVGVK